MKKILILIFSMALCVTLAACNSYQAVNIDDNSEISPLPASPMVTDTPADSNESMDTASDEYQFEVNSDNTVTITKYTGEGGDVKIPGKIDAWKAYRSILSGNFTLINEDEYKSEMEYLYKMDSQNEKCEWKYILMDFNKDGGDELFIQLTPNHDSALFHYEDGKIKCIYIDDLEMNCFIQPLKGGKLLETYNYWIAPTKTIFELNSEFERVNQKRYLSITVDDYEYYKENYGEIINQYPVITKEGVYYFQEIDGKVTELSKEDWERIQKDIDEQIVSDGAWKNCSELSAS